MWARRRRVACFALIVPPCLLLPPVPTTRAGRCAAEVHFYQQPEGQREQVLALAAQKMQGACPEEIERYAHNLFLGACC